jgi:hypothetical protein
MERSHPASEETSPSSGICGTPEPGEGPKRNGAIELFEGLGAERGVARVSAHLEKTASNGARDAGASEPPARFQIRLAPRGERGEEVIGA